MSAFSLNRRRILSLWLPRLPIDRIKRGLVTNNAELDKTPSVVVAKQSNALVIYALDDVAARSGLDIGLPLANARAICPELTVFDADPVADAKTLGDIADWCDRFTPLVALDPPHGLYLDITGCAHLFGGERALLQTVCGALTQRGFAVSAGIAGTSICARTMTRHVSGKIIADGEEADAVGPLPEGYRSRNSVKPPLRVFDGGRMSLPTRQRRDTDVGGRPSSYAATAPATAVPSFSRR